jgi:sulfotransferase
VSPRRHAGFAYSALKEAYYAELSDRLLLIDYDILTRKPEACLRLFYRFIGEAWRPHDVGNVEYDAPEFDGPLGAPGLHRVSGSVRAEARATMLPPDLFERFDELTFWNDAAGASAWRVAPEKQPSVSTADIARG